jgi:hypothetical protein
MHDAAYTFVADAVRFHGLLRRPGLTVEIGGRNVNGTVRPLFPRPYISIDSRPGPGVDIVADGATWAPSSPAVRVVCCEVLEHTPAAASICRQAYQMLEIAGVFIVTAASPARAPHSALDGGPVRQGEFYRGVDMGRLKVWLAPFQWTAIVEDPAVGDIYGLAWK